MSAAPPLSDVLLEVDGAIATVTLSRPEQRNPLSASMIRDIRLALDWCKQEAAVSVVVLTGAGDRAFCAGADLAAFGGDQSPLELHHSRHGLANRGPDQRTRAGRRLWACLCVRSSCGRRERNIRHPGDQRRG